MELIDLVKTRVIGLNGESQLEWENKLIQRHVEYQSVVYKRGPGPLFLWHKRILKWYPGNYQFSFTSLNIAYRKMIKSDPNRFELINKVGLETLAIAMVDARDILGYFKTKDSLEWPQGLIYLKHIIKIDKVGSKQLILKSNWRDFHLTLRTRHETETWYNSLSARIEKGVGKVEETKEYQKIYNMLVKGTLLSELSSEFTMLQTKPSTKFQATSSKPILIQGRYFTPRRHINLKLFGRRSSNKSDYPTTGASNAFASTIFGSETPSQHTISPDSSSRPSNSYQVSSSKIQSDFEHPVFDNPDEIIEELSDSIESSSSNLPEFHYESNQIITLKRNQELHVEENAPNGMVESVISKEMNSISSANPIFQIPDSNIYELYSESGQVHSNDKPITSNSNQTDKELKSNQLPTSQKDQEITSQSLSSPDTSKRNNNQLLTILDKPSTSQSIDKPNQIIHPKGTRDQSYSLRRTFSDSKLMPSPSPLSLWQRSLPSLSQPFSSLRLTTVPPTTSHLDSPKLPDISSPQDVTPKSEPSNPSDIDNNNPTLLHPDSSPPPNPPEFPRPPSLIFSFFRHFTDLDTPVTPTQANYRNIAQEAVYTHFLH